MTKHNVIPEWLKNLIRIAFFAAPFLIGREGLLLEGLSKPDATYAALQLYYAGIDAVAATPATPPYNIWVEIGRWWGPLALFVTGLSVIVDIVRGDMWPKIFCKIPGHCVVYGSAEVIEELCPASQRFFSRYWTIRNNRYTRSKRYLILFDSDKKNLEFYTSVLYPNMRNRKDVQVYMNSYELNQQNISEDGLIIVQTNAFIAREFFCNAEWIRKILGAVTTDKYVNIALVGFESLGEKMLETALLMNITKSEQCVRYHVWGAGNERKYRFENVEAKYFLPDEIIFHEESWLQSTDVIENMQVIILCGSEDDNLITLSRILENTNIAGNKNCDVYVYVENTDILSLLQIKNLTAKCELDSNGFLLGGRLHEFGAKGDEFISSVVEKGIDLYEKGKEGHQKYQGRYESLKWEEINAFYRWDNERSAAMNDVRKMLWDINKYTLEKILEQYTDIANELGSIEHISWVRSRALSGWEFAEQRNDSLKRHPNMRQYNTLSEDEKRKDYCNIMQELIFSTVDGLCRKKKYQVKVQKANPKKIYNVPEKMGVVYNFLENVEYHVKFGEIIVEGLLGEMWVISEEHLAKAYEIGDVILSENPVLVWTEPNEYEFRRVPANEQGSIPIAKDRVLTVNVDGIEHGEGDVLIRPVDGDDFWSVNGVAFERTYDVIKRS